MNGADPHQKRFANINKEGVIHQPSLANFGNFLLHAKEILSNFGNTLASLSGDFTDLSTKI